MHTQQLGERDRQGEGIRRRHSLSLARRDHRLVRLAVRLHGPAAVHPRRGSPALRELLAGDPQAARIDQDAQRLRHDVDDSRLGDRRHHLRDDERPARPREDDGGHAADLLRVHGALGARPLLGGLHDLPVSRRPRRRRDVRRRDDARGGERAGGISRHGARLAPGAVGPGQHHRLAYEPADSAWSSRRLRGATAAGGCCSSSASCPSLLIVPIMFVLKEPEAWLRAKAEAAPSGAVRIEHRLSGRTVPRPAVAQEHHHRPAARRVGHDRPVGHRLLLARVDLDRAARRAAGRRRSRPRTRHGASGCRLVLRDGDVHDRSRHFSAAASRFSARSCSAWP